MCYIKSKLKKKKSIYSTAELLVIELLLLIVRKYSSSKGRVII